MKFWKGLLIYVSGFLSAILLAGAGVGVVTTMIPAKDIAATAGFDLSPYLAENIYSKTVYEVFEMVKNGEIKYGNLNEISNITPLVDKVFDQLNEELDKNLGLTLDKEEFYTLAYADIPDYIVEYAKSNITLAGVLSVDEQSNKVLQYLAFKKNEDGEIDFDAPRSLADFMEEGAMSALIDEAKVQDLLDVGTEGLLYNLRDVTLVNFVDEIKNRKLNEILTITEDDYPALQFIGNYKMDEISQALSDATLGDLIEIDPENEVLYKLKDYKINELSDEIKNLELQDIMTINEDSEQILKALADTKIGDLPSKMETLTLGDAIEITEDSPKILQSLADTKITEIASSFDTLTLADVVNITEDSPLALKNLADAKVASIDEYLEDLRVKDVMEVTEDSPTIIKSIQDDKIFEIGERLSTITVGEVTTITEDSSIILKLLKDVQMNELTHEIAALKIHDIFKDDDNPFIKALPEDTTIDNLSEKLNNVKVTDVFHDQIWPEGDDGPMSQIWEYMLIDEDHCLHEDYVITQDMDVMLQNFKNNVKTATIEEMYNRGFIELSDPSILEKSIGYQGQVRRVGDLTFDEFLDAASSFLV